ncbi:hypothetical protein EV702DRAFT_1043551 [Suillus placidus]|uniref:Uncharacterized protein n=1 Tax=Suillus placidus TaxID=48579 RepID=A0A9P7D5T3_9AGAM|nr:hypothetical protein EV702DRAFT_1043551 [Suillus placidus]
MATVINTLDRIETGYRETHRLHYELPVIIDYGAGKITVLRADQYELEPWLASDKSYQAGTGVGLVSSAKIVDILKKNPDMDPEKYEEETKTKEELANIYKEHHKARLILMCLGGVTLNLRTAKASKTGVMIRSKPSRKKRASCAIISRVKCCRRSRGSGKGRKHKQSDYDEERLTTKRKRDTTDGRANRSNGDTEEETLARNRGKSKKSRPCKSPTRKSARNHKAVMGNY